LLRSMLAVLSPHSEKTRSSDHPNRRSELSYSV
jgi:hypothetical protein